MAEGNPVTPEEKPPKRRRKTRKKKGPKVTIKPQQHAARDLVTVGPDHPDWIGYANGETDAQMPGVKGAIVRLQPPANMPPEMVDAMEVAIRAGGAIAIKRLPPESAGDVVVRGDAAKGGWSALPHRELVDVMARDANVPDKDALAELVGTVMDQEGL